jgi:glutaredoxin
VSQPRITLLTRAGCHLCDVARQVLGEVAAASGEGWCEVDLDSDPHLLEEYWDRIPVILLDGHEHGYWRVDRGRLLRDLQAGPGHPARHVVREP